MDLNLILTVIAISTMGPFLGSLIGVIRYPSKRYMCNMLSFAAGVMLAISFLELIPESMHISSIWVCVAGIAFGALVMYGLDRFIPHVHPEMCSKDPFHRLKRTATYILVGIFLHNFPEGMAMAIGGVTEIRLSLIIAIAIAIHDIPEGICTSAPYFHVTRKRLKSFLVSFSTAIPTIAGFVLAYFMYQFIPLWAVGFVIAATAGLMIFISSDELIPISSSLTTSHTTIFSFLAGILFVILLGLL